MCISVGQRGTFARAQGPGSTVLANVLWKDGNPSPRARGAHPVAKATAVVKKKTDHADTFAGPGASA
jgi:hypothetical protein